MSVLTQQGLFIDPPQSAPCAAARGIAPWIAMATSAAAMTAKVPFVNLSIAAPSVAADCPPLERVGCPQSALWASRGHSVNALAKLAQRQLRPRPLHHRIERVMPMPISAVAFAGRCARESAVHSANGLFAHRWRATRFAAALACRSASHRLAHRSCVSYHS